jgi:hypothetical protein
MSEQQSLEAAFRDGYDFGQADRRFDVADADDAWSKSGTKQALASAPSAPQHNASDLFIAGMETERTKARLSASQEEPTQANGHTALIERLTTACHEAAKCGIWCSDYLLGGSPDRSLAYDEYVVVRARRAWRSGHVALAALEALSSSAPKESK